MAAALVAGSLVITTARSQADATNAPSLVISQFKITSSNGQFLTLYNATDTALDMSNYRLEYFNNYDLSRATSSRLIDLQGTLPPHSYYLVNDGGMLLCYRLTVDSVSLNFSSTAGMVEVLAYRQAHPGGSATPVLEDYVSWSKAAVPGVQTLPGDKDTFLRRTPVDADGNPEVEAAGSGSWQSVHPAGDDACALVTSGADEPVQTGMVQLLPGVEPAATIASVTDDAAVTDAVTYPAGDIGLMAPLITEVLPNPAGTGNDGTDEFIELYNPNSASFDLSGFALQAGTTSLHSYAFPAGTSLPPHGYAAYYPTATKLSLSNSGGQLKLLDPYGNAVYATAAYGSAKDGLAWALADGHWYWTAKLTPGLANVIVQPPTKKSYSKSATKMTGKTSATKTAKTSTKKLKATNASATSNAGDPVTRIHSSVLALVAGLALLYGAYEYRTDLRNRIYQLRCHLRTRHADRA